MPDLPSFSASPASLKEDAALSTSSTLCFGSVQTACPMVYFLNRRSLMKYLTMMAIRTYFNPLATYKSESIL